MRPIKLELENFSSHEKSVLDFSDFEVALIMGTYDQKTECSNGAGKSSIFDGIRWALYDKSRYKKKNGVVKRDKSECKVTFEFENEAGEKYRVQRKRNKVTEETDVVLEKYVDGEYADLSGDNNTITNSLIVEKAGLNDDVFINSVYFRQNDVSVFTDATPAQRKEIIKSILNMSDWDKYFEYAKDKKREIGSSIDAYRAQLLDKDYKSEIKNLELSIGKKESYISDQKKKLSSGSAELRKLEERYKRYSNEKNEGRLTELLDKKNMINVKASSIKADMEYAEKNLCELNEKLSSLKSNETDLKNSGRKLAKINIDELYQKQELLIKKLESTKAQVVMAKKNPIIDDKCVVCESKVSKDKKKHIEENNLKKVKPLTEKLNALKGEYKLVKEHIVVANKERAELEDIKSKVVDIKQRAKIIEMKIDDASEKITNSKSALKDIKDSFDFQEEIDELEKLCNKSEKNQIKERLDKISQDVDEYSSEIEKASVSLGIAQKELEFIKNEEVEQLKINDEINLLNQDFVIYDKLTKYYGRNGIQSVIIENIISELENHANNILDKISNEPTSISITTQKQTKSGTWQETFDIDIVAGSATDDFDSFSGGEKFRISFALRLALSEFLSKKSGSSVRFLLLDEVSSSLDDNGLRLFSDIVKRLASDMKILVITHDSKLKEMFDDIIMVTKFDDNGSKIVRKTAR